MLRTHDASFMEHNTLKGKVNLHCHVGPGVLIVFLTELEVYVRPELERIHNHVSHEIKELEGGDYYYLHMRTFDRLSENTACVNGL